MKNIRKFVVILVACLSMASCGKIQDIHLTNYHVASISPVGLRGLDVAVDLGIDNPAMQFTVSGISAEVFHKGTSLGTYTSNDVLVVKARTVANYRLSGRISLSQGVSVLQVIGYASKFDPADYEISYGANVKLKSGLHARLQKTKVPLTEFMEDKE